MSDDYLTRPAASRWHDGVEIGRQYAADVLLDHPMISFEGELRMSPGRAADAHVAAAMAKGGGTALV